MRYALPIWEGRTSKRKRREVMTDSMTNAHFLATTQEVHAAAGCREEPWRDAWGLFLLVEILGRKIIQLENNK